MGENSGSLRECDEVEIDWEGTFSGVMEMFHISENSLYYKAFAFVKIYQKEHVKIEGSPIESKRGVGREEEKGRCWGIKLTKLCFMHVSILTMNPTIMYDHV